MEEWYDKQLLDMMKALSDESRLTILRHLYQSEQNVGDLAKWIGLKEPTVSHHLARLREVGLVSLRMAGNQRFYRVNRDGLARFKRLASQVEVFPEGAESVAVDTAWIEALGWDAWDQEVLAEHAVNGRLVRLPVRQQKKLIVILRWLATLFEPEKRYSEAEVNAILKAVYERDHVSLRRDLISFGYLKRDPSGRAYWLAPEEERITEPVQA